MVYAYILYHTTKLLIVFISDARCRKFFNKISN
ncbi:MAG: hypothetical protein DRI97_11520 [Bacteroidetes bacterium]|nr:MAG: hypothetical protein DRI97_11520 [Bacteroidota bacterium]RLD71688.1 MAG: hypothetical protein DRI98_04450 [Bacteroidota bacterium]RLD93735.1 MAG: hypothetical protein DRJ29_07995 [Bacteroidota bacterium]RLE04976.1 MAG: hypothetical protein DRJ13_02855 [Bacteroidota bacterium]